MNDQINIISTHPVVLSQPEKDLKTYHSLLADMKAKRRGGGDIRGSLTVDRTADYIELIERMISELSTLLETSSLKRR